MLNRLGDSIITKLGIGSRKNYMAVSNGLSGVERCAAGTFGLPEPFMASLVDRELLDDHFMPIGGNRIRFYTAFEKLAILAAHHALQQAQIDAAEPHVLFVLSTTKGNIGLLDEPEHPYGPHRIHLWQSARLIAQFFGNANEPLVVSNACISGVCAQIQADRLLSQSPHSVAIVIGAEVLSKFVISGFQSFKALSATRCRPFDAQRDGLNLGEAAACIVYQKADAEVEIKKSAKDKRIEKAQGRHNDSSLAKIGGGGLTATRYDVSAHQLSEAKKQSKLLQKIAENTEKKVVSTEILMK